MAYQTGTASSPVNLLQTLSTWLAGRGWNANLDSAQGAGWATHRDRNGIFVNLRAANNETIWTGTAQNAAGFAIGMYLSTGWNNALPFHQQPGGPTNATVTPNNYGVACRLPNGPINAYHFFDDGNDNITVVVERAAGIFHHLGWGPNLVRAGAYTDGRYFFGSCGSFMTGGSTLGGAGIQTTADAPFGRCTADGGVDAPATAFLRITTGAWAETWLSNTSNTNPVNLEDAVMGRRLWPYSRTSPQSGQLIYDTTQVVNRLVSSAFQQAMLLPLFAQAETPDAGYLLLGHLPSVFLCGGVGAGYAAGQIYSLGSDDYMLFPNFAVRRVP